MKKCSRCGLDRPRSDYCRQGDTSDGLQVWCKPCKAEYRRGKKYREPWYATRARKAVARLVAKGDLPKPSEVQCRNCGAQAEHYHHWNYQPDHWEDVIPLCQTCHKKVHVVIKPMTP